VLEYLTNVSIVERISSKNEKGLSYSTYDEAISSRSSTNDDAANNAFSYAIDEQL
jgi:hypothetical protein